MLKINYLFKFTGGYGGYGKSKIFWKIKLKEAILQYNVFFFVKADAEAVMEVDEVALEEVDLVEVDSKELALDLELEVRKLSFWRSINLLFINFAFSVVKGGGFGGGYGK